MDRTSPTAARRRPAETLEELLSATPDDIAALELHGLDSVIDQFGGSIVLFGAGSIGRRAAALLRRDGRRVRCFADNDPAKWGQEVDGISVTSPAAAVERYASASAVLVTAWNNKHRYSDTLRQLQELGAEVVVPVSKLFWRYHDRFLPNYYQDLPHKVLQQADQVLAVMGVWADERSQAEYVGQVAARVSGDMAAFCEPVGDQYFPSELPAKFFERFLDGGAFDGDTIRELFSRYSAGVAAVWAVEPDPETFQRLRANVQLLPGPWAERITPIESALGSENSVISFSGFGSTSSMVDPAGSVQVSVKRIDDVIGDACPTLIKLDIEGAELDALRGARQTIARFAPALAICVYHTQDHLWRVPALIREYSDQYSFFLRAHAPDGWETVCYAVPQSESVERVARR